MKRFTVILEPSEDGFFAFVPGLPGCTSWGRTQGEVVENVREAIVLTLEYIRENGLSVDEDSSAVIEVLV